MKTPKFPKFDSYACVGDYIQWSAEGFDFVARIEYDQDSKPSDLDCYAPIKVKQWKNDEWFFCGVVLAVSYNGIELDEHAASLWGIECNYNKKANRYLSEVAKELESEAMQCAIVARERMLEALEA